MTDLYDAVLGDDTQTSVIPSTNPAKVIDIASLSKFNKKVDKTGIIYISRIPPGMGPAKLKHILSHYGNTGRVYLAKDPKDQKTSSVKGKGKDKHTAYRFAEGWIEFMDKSVARSTAELLNAKPIGGKPSSPFAADIWTLKYLPKFKWNMLSQSIAQQQAIETALLRNEISQSKKDQAGYLRQVEKARVIGKIEEKRSEKRKRNQTDQAGEGEGEQKQKKQRPFKQRTTIKSDRADQNLTQDSALQGVLDNLLV